MIKPDNVCFFVKTLFYNASYSCFRGYWTKCFANSSDGYGNATLRIAGATNNEHKALYALMFQESFEFACAYGVLEFAYCFCLDLPDSLAGDFEDSTHFLQRIGIAVADPVSQFDNLAFAI